MRAAVVVSSGLLMLLVWSLVSSRVGQLLLPSPAEVWNAFLADVAQGTWTSRIGGTLKHVVVSIVLVLVTGVPIGIAMGRWWFIEDLLRVPAILLQTIPTIALASIALISIGSSDTGVIVVTAASAFTYFTLSVVQGTRQVDVRVLEMARVYRATQLTVVRKILLPALVPHVLAATRVSLGVAWHVAVVAEYLMGTGGVGSALAADVRLLDTASVFSWALSIVVLTILLEYAAFRTSEHWLSRHLGWQSP